MKAIVTPKQGGIAKASKSRKPRRGLYKYKRSGVFCGSFWPKMMRKIHILREKETLT